MKKRSIKIISLMLALVTLFGVFASSNIFSVMATSQLPTVCIDGICSSAIVRFNEDGTKQDVFPPESSVIMDAVKNLPAYYQDALKKDNTFGESFTQAFLAGLKEVFCIMGCDYDGKPKENVTISYDNTIPQYKSDDRAYYFSYDWRISPYEVASQLNTYIKRVKETASANKVNIVAFSMGGAMFLTYLSQYGYDDINSVVMHSTAGMGASVCGLPMSGNVDVRPELLVQYLDCFIPDFDFKEVVIDIAKVLNKTYALNFTVDLLEAYIMANEEQIYEEILVPSFASCPGVWAMCPAENYEDAKNYVFKDGKDELYKNVIAVNDKYHYEVQANAKELLQGIKDRGGNLAIVSKYNCPLTPVMKEAKLQSDGVIDTKFTSYGAIVADINETLAEDYVQAKYTQTNYISPDRVIDASTCWFPQNTWFIKDLIHSGVCEDLYDFFDYVFASESQPVVNEEYSQFLAYDKKTDSISALEDTTPSKYRLGTWFEILFDMIINFFKTLFKIAK